jgi:hypothetical protein
MRQKEIVTIIVLNGLLKKSKLPYVVQTLSCVNHRDVCYCHFFIPAIKSSQWEKFLKNNSDFIEWKVYDAEFDWTQLLTVYVSFKLGKQSKGGLTKCLHI